MLQEIEAIARRAGDAVMQVYRRTQQAGGIVADPKADGSPLTEADTRSHALIDEGLRRGWPELPILSEEGKQTPYSVRREWGRFWLVDPLDGTKEFIKGLDEFTVNIALIEAGRPVLGVVYAPATDVMFSGSVGAGATVRRGGGPAVAIRVRPPAPGEGLVVMASRSHPSAELEAYLQSLQVAELIEAGSSLKLCAVAEGRAHIYPRLGPTSEWDIAAGQAVVEAAGGEVVDLDGRPLVYNKESLLNPSFIARAAH